jgi:hypothetical protein
VITFYVEVTDMKTIENEVRDALNELVLIPRLSLFYALSQRVRMHLLSILDIELETQRLAAALAKHHAHGDSEHETGDYTELDGLIADWVSESTGGMSLLPVRCTCFMKKKVSELGG